MKYCCRLGYTENKMHFPPKALVFGGALCSSFLEYYKFMRDPPPAFCLEAVVDYIPGPSPFINKAKIGFWLSLDLYPFYLYKLKKTSFNSHTLYWPWYVGNDILTTSFFSNITLLIVNIAHHTPFSILTNNLKCKTLFITH